jgi:ABC-type dipeptide/oligopeptide/nickel transport system permease component
MIRYLVGRVIQSAIVLLGTSLLVFGLLRIVPSDPVDLLSRPGTPEAQKAVQRRALGLDQPLYVQYGVFLRDALRGDFGTSFRFNQPASALVLHAFPATLALTLLALGLAVMLGGPLGILAAMRPGSLADRVSMVLAVVGQSIPNFWLGIVLIIVFAVRLRWLPTSGSGSVQQAILPTVTLASYNIALIARLTRSGMRDALRQDYIRTARAKGLGESTVLTRHALRNALIPIVTVIGLQFGTLLGGAVIVETVFAWPGIGNLVINAIGWRDYPIVQAVVLLSALSFVLINFVLDAAYSWLDPRIRHG